jgi:hypothetical protein
MEISNEEKQILLTIAKNSVAGIYSKTDPAEIDSEKYPVLDKKCGAFVTLTINKKLRGCIGYIITENPLYETIKSAAKKAAVEDPRFPPLRKSELKDISIEISVLSEPFKMNSYDEIELGKHGLIVTEGFRRGLLLPQVPFEHGMDKDEYLSALCQKAGLPADAWKEKVLDIEMFTASVFSEREEND